jgi:predicted Zn-dependent protease
MESLERTIQRYPYNADARYALGRIYYFNQRPDPAAAQFEAIIARHPDHYRAWDNLGLAREAGGKIPEAIQAHLRAIALTTDQHKEYDWAHANLAELLMKENDNKKAFNLAVEAAQRNPQSARNFYLAGKALFRLDQAEKCTRWLERSTQLDPAYPEPWYLLGQVYRRLNREADAEKARQRFLTLKAKAPDKKR